MRIVILCDLCKQPLTVPKDSEGKFRRDSHYHGSINYFNTDRVFSRTGFRFKGQEVKAMVCTPCWTEKVRPTLEGIGVKFDTEDNDGTEDQEYIRAPDPYPREFKIDEHEMYTIVSCLLSRQRGLREGCYDEGQQKWIDKVIEKLGGVPPRLKAWLAECDAARTKSS